MSKYIKVDDLQKYCDNQKNHSITPNEFQRMTHYDFGWHTGTPTEEGWYLVQHLSDAKYCGSKFFVARWDGEKFIINPRPPIVVTHSPGTAWQKIEPYKEKDK